MAREKLVDEKYFIGKMVEIQCTDRPESTWGPLMLNSISALGVVGQYESRGVSTSVFVPLSTIGSITTRFSQTNQSAAESEE